MPAKKANNDHRTPSEEGRRLSRSVLWKGQWTFSGQQGVNARNIGNVPHYATSNPFMAHAYGEMVLAFMRDCQALDAYDPDQPVYLLEFGAGPGRFAFHFLKQFVIRHSRSALCDMPFQYLMTDPAQENVDFWQSHPALQPFVAQGVLDFSRFDVEKDEEFHLGYSGQCLSAETIKNPVIVIANSFFGSLPQDVFTLKDGTLYENLVSWQAPGSDPDLTDPDTLEKLQVTWTDRPLREDYYEDPHFNRLLEHYRETIDDTTLLFPCEGLRCIRKLHKFSGGRMLMLSAGKGYSRDDALPHRTKPEISFRQSPFSMMVNYNAIGRYVQQLDGQALTLPYRHHSLSMNAFLLDSDPDHYIETGQAWDEAIENSSPDDFFALKKGIEKNYDDLSLQELIACLRFSRWDARLFTDSYGALSKRAKTATMVLKEELVTVLDRIWESYYFIGEPEDLPFHIALLLYDIGYYDRALEYFSHSLSLYGKDPITFYNIAMCYHKIGWSGQALERLHQSLLLNPHNPEALSLKVQLESTMKNGQSLARELITE